MGVRGWGLGVTMAREKNSQQTLHQYAQYLEDLREDCGDSAIPLTFQKWYERDYESQYDEESYD